LDSRVTRAVLFDLDGVVIHPWGFRDQLARDYGITPEMTLAFFQGPFVDCVEGRVDVLDALSPFLVDWGWTGDPPAFVDCWLAAENALNHDVLAIVRALRAHGLPCFAASTQERRRARYLAHDLGLARVFDGLFFSCDLGVMKPRPGYYAAVAASLRHDPGELLFFDDQPANVDGARAAGWVAERFTSVDQLRADLARHVNVQV
jgi:putative hydrolase of the HAD superfamily